MDVKQVCSEDGCVPLELQLCFPNLHSLLLSSDNGWDWNARVRAYFCSNFPTSLTSLRLIGSYCTLYIHEALPMVPFERLQLTHFEYDFEILLRQRNTLLSRAPSLGLPPLSSRELKSLVESRFEHLQTLALTISNDPSLGCIQCFPHLTTLKLSIDSSRYGKHADPTWYLHALPSTLLMLKIEATCLEVFYRLPIALKLQNLDVCIVTSTFYSDCYT